ncbi:MAG TPA: hypothetical protein VGB77_09545 [Abditibacteriaceae bacterium]
MGLSNVKDLCFFAKHDEKYKDANQKIVLVDFNALVKDFPTCEQDYGFAPSGVNTYFGFSANAIQNWKSAQASDPQAPILGSPGNHFTHSAQIDRVLDALNQPNGPSVMRVIFALQPEEISDPFGFMHRLESTEALTQMAKELEAKAKKAAPGKRLDIVIRFASEMNTPENKKWGYSNPAATPKEFIRAFKEVRRVFRDVAPIFQMSFSPAVRSDLTFNATTRNSKAVPGIKDYYPGIANIDFLSGSWYAGSLNNVNGAFSVLEEYFSNYKGLLKTHSFKYALDEWGGTKSTTKFAAPLKRVGDQKILQEGTKQIGWEAGSGHEEVLKKMAQKLDSFAADGITLEYATLFLQKKWNPRQILNLPFV